MSEWHCVLEQCDLNACYHDTGNDVFVRAAINITVVEEPEK
jgi:hypothetical protein